MVHISREAQHPRMSRCDPQNRRNRQSPHNFASSSADKTGGDCLLRWWARTDGVPTLRVRNAVVPIVLILGCGFVAAEVRGGGQTLGSASAVPRDAGKADAVDTNPRQELEGIARELSGLSQA